MKRFYNQTNKDIETLENGYKQYTYNLDISSTYGLNYYKEVDNDMQRFFAQIESTSEPVLFQIAGDFNLLKNIPDEDKVYFILAITNIFASNFFTKEKTEGEYRLTPYKSIETIKLNSMVKKDFTNKKMKYPFISMEVVDLNNNVVYEVM